MVEPLDEYKDGSDLPSGHRYHASQLISSRNYVSNQVVIERTAQMPEKTKNVSLSDAYYHLYQWHFCGLSIDYHLEVGKDLHQIVYRMLKYRCHRDPELLAIIESEVPGAFYKINGGGKILTRVQGSIGLRDEATLKELWQIMRQLINLSNDPSHARLSVNCSKN